MPSDYIPQGYITLSELLERYIQHQKLGLSDPELGERNAAEREKLFASIEDELAEFFRKDELRAFFRLPGSEENMRVKPDDWKVLGWPSRPFRGAVMAFPREPWSEFEGRTLFVEETAVKRWLSGRALPSQAQGRNPVSSRERLANSTTQKRHYRKWDWKAFENKHDELIDYLGSVDSFIDPQWSQARIVDHLERWSHDKWQEAPSRSQLNDFVSKRIGKPNGLASSDKSDKSDKSDT